MPVYKFKFGEINVADGLPPLTPALMAWVEGEADRLFGIAMQTVVDGLVERLAVADCANAIAAPCVVGPLPTIASPEPLPHLSTVQIGALSTTQLEPSPTDRPLLALRAKRLDDGAVVEFSGQDLGVVDAFYQTRFVINGVVRVSQQPVTALAAATNILDARMALDLEFLRLVCGLDPETFEVVA